MPPATESVLVVGPMEAATKRGLADVENCVGCVAGQFGGAQVQVAGLVGDAEFGQDQRRRAEAVGLDDVRAGREVGSVDVADDVRPAI